MALLINGITRKTPYSRPVILSGVYAYAPFEPVLHVTVLSEDGLRTFDKDIEVEKPLRQAWALVQHRTHVAACQAYFKTLWRGKSLSDVMTEGDVTLHCLVPKGNHTFDELPLANSAGRDIGLNPNLLLMPGSAHLACTLIHELAHVAGATTSRYDANAGAAEESLLHCQCKTLYNPANLGSLARKGIRRFA